MFTQVVSLSLSYHVYVESVFTQLLHGAGMWVLPNRDMESTSVGCCSTPPFDLPLRSQRCYAALCSAHLTSSPWQLQILLLTECGTMMTQLHFWCCTSTGRVCGPALQRHRHDRSLHCAALHHTLCMHEFPDGSCASLAPRRPMQTSVKDLFYKHLRS